jgi:hypothetical protein
VAAKAGGAAWWAGKVRQFGGHVRARVAATERDSLVAWLTPAEVAAFDAMHVADRRHGLDVVNALRTDGIHEPDVLVAGLLHDAGKGRTGVLPRVAYSLGQAYGPWVWRLASVLPGFGAAIARLRDHPERSASIAAAAGCSDRTVDLIRHQDRPLDPQFGELLRLADEAN